MDTIVVESGISTGILYEGAPLEAQTRYYWNVTVTDTAGNEYKSQTAYFETGTDWDGVSWIVPSDAPEAGNTYAIEEKAATEEEEAEYSRHGGAPLLRMEKKLSGTVKSARLYMTALGNYDAYINGEKILSKDVSGDNVDAVFAPGWTDYKDYTNYQTYDVTDLLANAENGEFALGVAMHKGWYAGKIADWSNSEYESIGVTGTASSTYEARQLALLGKLVVVYDDGTTETFFTNDDEWKSIAGPIEDNDFYLGEKYNANRAKELEGWNNTGYDDAGWYEVTEFSDYQGELRANNSALAHVVDRLEVTPVSAYTYKESETEYPDEMPPESGTFTPGENDWYGEIVEHPVKIDQPIELSTDDILIVNMGQNMVGVPEIEVSGAEGTTIKMRHMEMLNDGKLNPTLDADAGGSDGPKGTLHYSSLRDPNGQTLYYTLSDDEVQTYRPSSTYMGFQYMEITADEPITISGIHGIVISSVDEQLGTLETSDEKVNKLISNVLWSQLGNYTTVPTDCPQRNERQGWTGDAQLFSQSAVYNFDSTAFLDTYVQMLKNHCEKTGSFGSTVPGTSGGLNSGWSDVGVIIPWVLYQQTGDSAFIDENYDTMDLYMNNVYENGYQEKFFGDWVSFVGASTIYMNAVYEIYCTQLMEKMALVIGREDMEEKYHNKNAELKEAFLAEPVIEEREVDESNPEGIERIGGGFVYANGDLMSYGPILSSYVPQLQNNAQTALLWALKLGLYKDEEHRAYLVQKLVENIRNKDGEIRPGQPENTLAVGFLGVNVLLPILSDEGASDVAYDLLLQEEMPSWLFSVVNGSTTIWERWNAYSVANSFGPYTMNSFNHYSYGACIEWMYKYMSGINKDEETPGFKHIILQPAYDESGRISFVNGSYESLYGRIESNWSTEDGTLSEYHVAIPANTTATLYLPINSSAVENFENIPGITYSGIEEYNGNTCAVFEVAAGGFDFTVENGMLTASLQEGYTVE